MIGLTYCEFIVKSIFMQAFRKIVLYRIEAPGEPSNCFNGNLYILILHTGTYRSFLILISAPDTRVKIFMFDAI